MTEITGLWIKKDKNGNSYFSGRVPEEVSIAPGSGVMIFKNTNKESENHPDYRLFAVKNQAKASGGSGAGTPEPDDDLPF